VLGRLWKHLLVVGCFVKVGREGKVKKQGCKEGRHHLLGGTAVIVASVERYGSDCCFGGEGHTQHDTKT
jgi:hypothetical protein